MKILAIIGSNHSKSIHFKLVQFISSLPIGSQIEVLDMRDWKIPVYSIDMDPNYTPRKIRSLLKKIPNYDSYIIASPEHNGGVSAFLKNILDWVSRRQKKIFAEKPILLITSSPGKNGGRSQLDYLTRALPFQGASKIESFSLPNFYQAFEDGKISDQEKLDDIQGLLKTFLSS